MESWNEVRSLRPGKDALSVEIEYSVTTSDCVGVIASVHRESSVINSMSDVIRHLPSLPFFPSARQCRHSFRPFYDRSEKRKGEGRAGHVFTLADDVTDVNKMELG